MDERQIEPSLFSDLDLPSSQGLLRCEESLGTMLSTYFDQEEDTDAVVQTEFRVQYSTPSLGFETEGSLASSFLPASIPLASPGSPSSNVPSPSPHQNTTQTLPATSSVFPCNVNDAGQYGFTLEFDREMSVEPMNRSSNTYSPLLHKLYCTVNTACPLRFRTKDQVAFGSMIRATPIYTTPRDMARVVRRCPSCVVEHDTGAESREHLVVVDPPQSCFYRTDNGRFSVMIPFEPNTTDDSRNMTVIYRFMCRTSCPGAGKRRPMSVLFTLENQGRVYGRACLQVRVCASPGRDREKDELRRRGSHVAESNDEDQTATSPAKPRKRGRKRKNDGAGAPADKKKSEGDDASPEKTVTSADSERAKAVTQHFMRELSLNTNEDHTKYTIEVIGYHKYQLVKSFLDALDLMDYVKHLGNAKDKVAQHLADRGVQSLADADAASAFEGESMMGSQPRASQASVASASGSTSAGTVRFSLKRTITPRLGNSSEMK